MDDASALRLREETILQLETDIKRAESQLSFHLSMAEVVEAHADDLRELLMSLLEDTSCRSLQQNETPENGDSPTDDESAPATSRPRSQPERRSDTES